MLTVLRAFLSIAALLCASLALAGEEQAADKRIAITFDDAPRHQGAFFSQDERTQILIDALREAGVEQAAFFVNPGKLQEYEGAEARLEAYVAAGHVIANHTATHPRLSQTETQDFIADLDAAQIWLADRPGLRDWFRFPYLDEGRADKEKRDALRAALAQRSLINASPTVDASDWWIDSALNRAEREGADYDKGAAGKLFVQSHVESAEFYHKLALETFERPIAHNILLHETDLSAMFIADLIEALRDAGWTIVTADEAFADPAYLGTPEVPSAQGTLVELAAWHKGIGSQRWYPGNDTKLLEQRFNSEVLGQANVPVPKTVNSQVLGDAKEFAASGPAKVCMANMAITLREDETAYLTYSGIHAGSLVIRTPTGDFEILNSDHLAEPRSEGRPFFATDRTDVFLDRDERGTFYRVFLDGKDGVSRPIAFIRGEGVSGRAKDRLFIKRITFTEQSHSRCDVRYSYGWDVIFGEEAVREETISD